MNYVGTEHLYQFFSQYPLHAFSRKEIILKPDSTPPGVYYLKQGHVRLFLRSEKDTEFTILIYKPGDIFPIRWAVNNVENIYFFEAANEVETYLAPRKDFIQHTSRDTQFSREIMSQLSFDFGAVVYRMQHLVFGSAYTRVSSVLVTAAKRFGEGDGTITIPFQLTPVQIAASAGITRPAVDMQLKKLKKAGIIEYEDNVFTVKDIPRLEQIAYV